MFGRGFGEAIVVHLGDGIWACIDSCLNPISKQAAALTYLSAIGVSANSVRLVGITHWDDDHVAGISELVRNFSSATVSCSAALRKKEVIEFVLSTEMAGAGLGSGVDELRTILNLCNERGQRILWAKANLPLYPQPPGDNPQVIALSPSENAVQRSVESLIKEATRQDVQVQRRYKAPEGPNGASVAMSVRTPGIAVLLGADLETSNNPESGWTAVAKYSAPAVQASLVKVPHHGSSSAHHDAFWSDLAANPVVAIVTAWLKGGRHLPTDDDLARLRGLASEVYLTARPQIKQVRLESEKRAMFRKLHLEQIDELIGWGHVRARRQPGEQAWKVDLDGDAVAV